MQQSNLQSGPQHAQPAASSEPVTVVCHECRLRVQIPPLTSRQKAICPRCKLTLSQYHVNASERIIAFASAGLIFLALSIPFDFLAFSTQGQSQKIAIPGGMEMLVDQGHLPLALVQLLAIIVFPAMILCGLLYLLVPLRLGFKPAFSHSVMKMVFVALPWSMAEIFLIGVLISLIKISEMADVDIGLSFYTYAGFTLCLVLTVIHLDKQQLARELDLTPQDEHTAPRTQSIQHTWAWLFTALVLYIPANMLPIMNTRVLGRDQPNTILGGVVELWHMGSYPIALVILIASVMVPVAKLVILTWLNYSVQKGLTMGQEKRMSWYRVTEFIGRWSMIDVFVVAVLVSLIQLGNAMSVFPGPAALAFCGVVIATMLAAITFDTRLIWDANKHHE